MIGLRRDLPAASGGKKSLANTGFFSKLLVNLAFLVLYAVA
jgi:hypothetical protein